MNRPDSDTPLDSCPTLSTPQVARALGVSVTTVKRWVDDQILAAYRTPGGHRKFRLADVLRLTRNASLPSADLTELVPKGVPTGTPDVDRYAREFLLAAEAGDRDQIRELLKGGLWEGLAVETLADRVVAPAMHAIGHGWEAGRVDVMEEHRLTQAVVAALYEVEGQARTAPPEERPVALCGAPEHDHYVLPSLLTRLTLLGCGWDAVNLGPHTPMFAFRAAVEKLDPQLVCVSATHLADRERFVTDFNGFSRDAMAGGVVVAVGGQALTEDVRKRMEFTSYGDNLTQLAALARSLNRRPGLPKRGRPPAKRPPLTEPSD